MFPAENADEDAYGEDGFDDSMSPTSHDAAPSSKYHTKLLSLGVIILPIFVSVTTACAKRTGAAASVEHRRREPDRAILPE